jgi:capsule polysaccharide export protein KpsE/RkpR
LASLGALSGLASTAIGTKSPADQYVALMQSTTIANRLLERFDLQRVYGEPLAVDARKQLEANTRLSVGTKDGLLYIEVDDHDPQRAADIANQYVEELRRLTSVLAVSEAQQRRLFFEQQLKSARDELDRAQQALQASGFNQGALRAEPRVAAEGYARLKAELAASEVQLQGLRGRLADTTPEVQQLLAIQQALRAQLARMEQVSEVSKAPDYVTKYREFSYREKLFELIARQFEVAKVDESREGALIQVLDTATAPERKSKPKRALTAAASALVALLLLVLVIVMRRSWQRVGQGLRHD